jgi:hypothetical protein
MFGGQGKDGTYIIEHTRSLRAMGILDRDDMIQSFSFGESLTCSAVLIESSYQKEPQIKHLHHISLNKTKCQVYFFSYEIIHSNPKKNSTTN